MKRIVGNHDMSIHQNIALSTNLAANHADSLLIGLPAFAIGVAGIHAQT